MDCPAGKGTGLVMAKKNEVEQSPEGVTVRRDTRGFYLAFRWYCAETREVGFAFLTLALGVVVLGTILAVANMSVLVRLLPGSLPLLAWLFLWLLCGYPVLAWFLNRTEVRVDPLFLSVRPGPLPWFGKRELPRGALKRLSVRTGFSFYPGEGFDEARRQTRYHLVAETGDRRAVKLLSLWNGPGKIDYIRRELERALGIERP